MKNDYDNNGGDKEFGNTLDYYNDELSRKAVGKLFDNDGDGASEAAVTSDPSDQGEDGPQRRPSSRRREVREAPPREIVEAVIPVEPPKVKERPISNHFYEEARADANEVSEGIVRGFEEGDDRPNPRPRNREALERKEPGEGRPSSRIPREAGEASESTEQRPLREPGEGPRRPREPREPRESGDAPEVRRPREPGAARSARMAREAEEGMDQRVQREPGEGPRRPRPQPGEPGETRIPRERRNPESDDTMPESRPPRRRREESGTVGSAIEADSGSERDKYRQQFLGDMEKDPKRNLRRKGEEEDRENAREPGQRRTAPRSSAPRSSARGQGNQEYAEEFENAEKRYSTRRTQPIRDEERLYPSQQGQGAKRSNPYRQPEYATAEKSQGLLSMPIFRIIAVAFVLMLLILIFMIFKLNGVNKELKELQSIDANSVVMTKEEYDAIVDELEIAKGEVARLNQTNSQLTLKVEALEEPETLTPPDGEGEGEGTNDAGNRTYTVAPGDTLSSISQQFYGTSGEYQRIMDANGITNPNQLRPNTTLIIP